MTRDQIAIEAMKSIIKAADYCADSDKDAREVGSTVAKLMAEDAVEIAQFSYAVADAMLAMSRT